jgi:outer membrane murein-binding lipoprotein Lpp
MSNASEVKELNKKVNNLENQLAEMLSLLKSANTKE